jgi:hypothetical protein
MYETEPPCGERGGAALALSVCDVVKLGDARRADKWNEDVSEPGERDEELGRGGISANSKERFNEKSPSRLATRESRLGPAGAARGENENENDNSADSETATTPPAQQQRRQRQQQQQQRRRQRQRRRNGSGNGDGNAHSP